MVTLKFFNVYKGVNEGALYKDLAFTERHPDYEGMPSTLHRTVTGPFDSLDEARENYERRGAKDSFLKTIPMAFDLGD